MTNRQTHMEVQYSEQMRQEVHVHLERLLADSHFALSKRFPAFLRFIVEEELHGRGPQLKERTLGVEVFGRRPDYDTTADPIVRVTAAEIRKRIAQYYQGDPTAPEVKISLPPGSYVPHFEWLIVAAHSSGFPQQVQPGEKPELKAVAESEREVNLQPEPWAAAARQVDGKVGRRWFAIAAALVVLLALGVYFLRPAADPLRQFWEPIFAAEGQTVVICVPHSETQTVTLRDARQPALIHSFPEQAKALYLDDVQPLVNIAGLLGQAHRQYQLLDDTVPLTDLRQGPTVFLGAFDNDWTLRITHDLRFRFNNDAEMQHFWIEDSKHPERRWQVDRKLQVSTNNYRDYAIVARFVSPSTGQLSVVSAGIARGGTVAAGEFLTRAGTINAIREHAPAGWAKQNMELVLSTEIIDGRSAPPRIEAMEFW